jgi:hypothetical protein
MQLYRARTQALPPRMPGGPPAPWFSQRMDFMRRMGDRLGLSEEQRNRIDAILRESQQRSRELWEPLAPKFKEEMERTKHLIDAELTAEQRAKAEIIQRERFSGPPGERGPGRWREGEGTRPRSRGSDRNPSEYGPFPPAPDMPRPDGPPAGATPPGSEMPPPDRSPGGAAPPPGHPPRTE